MDDFLQAASAERPPSYEMLSEVCAHGVLVHDQLFHACKAHEVLISSETIHLVGIDKVSSEFAFPGQRAQAQLHVGLIFYAIELFDLFDAVVVLANNDLRCCARFRCLAGGQLLDHDAKDIKVCLDIAFKLFGIIAFLLGGQDRNHEGGEQKRDHDHAARQEQDQLTLRDSLWEGQDHRQGNGAFRASKRHDGGGMHVMGKRFTRLGSDVLFFRGFLVALCDMSVVHALHQQHPYEANGDKDQADG